LAFPAKFDQEKRTSVSSRPHRAAIWKLQLNSAVFMAFYGHSSPPQTITSFGGLPTVLGHGHCTLVGDILTFSWPFVSTGAL